MTTVPVLPDRTAIDPATPSGRGKWRPPRFLRRTEGALGAAWLAVLVSLSVTTPLWRPYAPNAQNLAARLQGPSAAHLFGTDGLGRDVLTRIFAAAGPALLGATIATAVALALAIPLVLIAAERRGHIEWLLSHAAEVVLVLPGTIILLAIIGVVGGNRIYLLMSILGVLASAPLYRILLNVAQALHKRLYIDAARVDGVSSVRIGLRYVLPGLGNVVAVQGSQLFAAAILIESGLAFMGFGPAQPTASWGGMIATASQYIYQDPWLMMPTGIMLALTVIAVNALALALSPEGAAPPHRSRREQGIQTRGIRSNADEPTSPLPAPIFEADAPLVDVRNLTLAIDAGPLLVTDVSLQVRSREVLGIIGESGCGKTMTALALLGLLPPQVSLVGGSIRFQGRELVGLREKQLRAMRGRDMAMIPQDPMVALDPLFTIGTQLTEPIRRLHRVGAKVARQIAIEHLRRVEIPDPERVFRARPYELSGGMAQRVTIAMALSGAPRLLIADEPTTALDVTVQMEILDLLIRLVHETGIAMILVSHDMGVIADVCDDVAVMYAGEIVEQGAVFEVLEHAQHPYTLALLAANPLLTEGGSMPTRLRAIPGRVPRHGYWPPGCRFCTRCEFAIEQCQKPIKLETTSEGASVRCIRIADIKSGAPRKKVAVEGTTEVTL